jgi:hypothetical protein
LRLFRRLIDDGKNAVATRRTTMSLKMGRMTKRNRAKHRRRAYEAGMLQKTFASLRTAPRPVRSTDGTLRDLDDKRAA